VKPATLPRIFAGPEGLRAGWSLLIFVVLMAAPLTGERALGSHFHLVPKKGAAQEITPSYGVYTEALPLITTFLVTWIMSKIEGRRASVYGLAPKRALPNFLTGMAWGVVCLSLLVLALWKTGFLIVDGRLLFGGASVGYGALWLFIATLVGFLEEYLTRGFVLFTLTRGLAGVYTWLFKSRHAKPLGFWTAALLLSILFGLGHGKNPGESPLGLLSAGLGGLVFCLSLWRTGSLWWAIGFHASWDWAQSFLYGVADSGNMIQQHLMATHPVGAPLMSGGATGPEGSIFVLLIFPLIILIILFTLPRRDL
jgi:membrane protease YdiL (CAAX protease family)